MTGLALETAGAWQKFGNKNLTQTGRPRANFWRSPRLAAQNHHPLQHTFFPPGSARFPPGSAGFAGFLCRVPPPGCRVPLGSASPGPFHHDSPFNLLLGLCQVLARRLPRLRQSKKRLFAIARALSKSKITNKMASLVE